MKIRNIKKSELRKLGEIMLKEFSAAPFNEVANIEDVVKSLNFYHKNANIFIMDDVEIVGAIIFQIEQWWEGKVIVIQDLFSIKENAEESFILFLEKYARERGIKKIAFTTNKKSPGIKLYGKLGYNLNKDRINMEKKL